MVKYTIQRTFDLWFLLLTPQIESLVYLNKSLKYPKAILGSIWDQFRENSNVEMSGSTELLIIYLAIRKWNTMIQILCLVFSYVPPHLLILFIESNYCLCARVLCNILQWILNSIEMLKRMRSIKKCYWGSTLQIDLSNNFVD